MVEFRPRNNHGSAERAGEEMAKSCAVDYCFAFSFLSLHSPIIAPFRFNSDMLAFPNELLDKMVNG